MWWLDQFFPCSLEKLSQWVIWTRARCSVQYFCVSQMVVVLLWITLKPSHWPDYSSHSNRWPSSSHTVKWNAELVSLSKCAINNINLCYKSSSMGRFTLSLWELYSSTCQTLSSKVRWKPFTAQRWWRNFFNSMSNCIRYEIIHFNVYGFKLQTLFDSKLKKYSPKRTISCSIIHLEKKATFWTLKGFISLSLKCFMEKLQKSLRYL